MLLLLPEGPEMPLRRLSKFPLQSQCNLQVFTGMSDGVLVYLDRVILQQVMEPMLQGRERCTFHAREGKGGTQAPPRQGWFYG